MRPTTEFLGYNDKVMDYLEYLGYPEYVESYEPEAVAKSLSNTIAIMFYSSDWSYRMTALFCFGCTMVFQVMKYDDKVN